MPKIYAYTFGGCTVMSSDPIDGLVTSETPSHGEAVISVERTALAPADDGWRLLRDDVDGRTGSRIRVWRGEAGLRLRFEYLEYFADYVIADGGRRILVATAPDVPDLHRSALLAGPVLGRALRIMGRPCLHATVCARHDKAIALIAPSGGGKSSLALALVRQGWEVVTDDMAVLEQTGPRLLVHPGLPRVKLWPDAVDEAAADHAVEMFPGVADSRKVSVDLGVPRTLPIPLHAIYQLAPRGQDLTQAVVSPLSPPAAVAALSANIYGTLAGDADLRRAELRLSAELASRVPVVRLQLPDRLTYLSEQGAALAERLQP